MIKTPHSDRRARRRGVECIETHQERQEGASVHHRKAHRQASFLVRNRNTFAPLLVLLLLLLLLLSRLLFLRLFLELIRTLSALLLIIISPPLLLLHLPLLLLPQEKTLLTTGLSLLLLLVLLVFRLRLRWLKLTKFLYRRRSMSSISFIVKQGCLSLRVRLSLLVSAAFPLPFPPQEVETEKLKDFLLLETPLLGKSFPHMHPRLRHKRKCTLLA